MNKMTQAALAALVLGACSAGAFADEAAKSGGNNDRWKGCTEMGCSKDIPIKLHMPKKCTISDPKDLVLKTDASNATSTYSVTTNTHYILNLSTANAGTDPNTFVKNGSGNKISTVITTTKNSGSAGPSTPSWGNNNYAGLSVDNFTVTARTKAAVPATTAAGDYTDTYKIRVYY
ncbi:MAG: hypothetical protein ACN6OV_09680 [Acinetobacter sp.]|uniref:hypothetical protein n=1 Tax=Acinetobacter sp. TaxID=472 RepID=UPI003CFE7080